MNKKPQKESNPQLLVIYSLLEDWKGMEKSIEILIRGPEPKPKEGKKDEEEDEEADKLALRIANLPERHLALIQVMRRDNYYRNLNKTILNILHWLPTNAQEALEEGETENAIALAIAWEEKMHEIFQECYPNEREFRLALLESISKMHIVAMPGAMKAYSVSGDIPREVDWKS